MRFGSSGTNCPITRMSHVSNLFLVLCVFHLYVLCVDRFRFFYFQLSKFCSSNFSARPVCTCYTASSTQTEQTPGVWNLAILQSEGMCRTHNLILNCQSKDYYYRCLLETESQYFGSTAPTFRYITDSFYIGSTGTRHLEYTVPLYKFSFAKVLFIYLDGGRNKQHLNVSTLPPDIRSLIQKDCNLHHI